MSEKFVTEIVKSEMMTLSQLVWRLLRRQPAWYIERVLNANQNLDMDKPYLPVGTVVKLPVENIEDQPPAAAVIRLWD